MNNRAQDFSVRWTGMVTFAETGSYQFVSASDDGSRVYFDGDLVLDQWAASGSTWRSSPVHVANAAATAGTSGTVSLSHSVIYEVVQYDGSASASLVWEKGSDHCPQGQLWSQYFTTPDLSGDAVTAGGPACENTVGMAQWAVHYDWGNGAPTGLPNDHFSVRWMGEVTIPTGSYAFIAHSDDGSKIFVDGNLVLDRWGMCCAQWESEPVYVVGGGSTSIVYDFREDGGGAYADLTWETRTCDTGFQALYYENEQLAGNPVTSACEEYPLNRHWDESGVAEMGGLSDHWSARWAGSFDFGSMRYYSFTSTSDDGSRILIDGRSVLDRWSSSGVTSTSAPVQLSGNHQVAYELVQHSGDASAVMSWGEVLCAPSGGPPSCAGVVENSLVCPDGMWRATYYSNEALIAPAQYAACEQNIHRQWTGIGVDQLAGRDSHFSIRWVGRFDFGGTYQFQMRSDDGSRLFVDNNVVLDRWTTCCSTWTSDTVDLPGSALVTFEMVNYGPGSYADLTWINNGCGAGLLMVEYFATGDLSGSSLPNANMCARPEDANWPGLSPTGQTMLNWGNGAPEVYGGTQIDNFSIRWSGDFDFQYGRAQEPGTYVFTVSSDDGSRLIMDGTTVLDQWGTCCAIWNSAPVFIAAGSHLLVYEFHEIGGGAYAGLSWETSGCATNQLMVSFYDNPSFRGSPVNGAGNCEPVDPLCTGSSCTPVNRDWGQGGVAELNGQVDQFSARWEGTFDFTEGDYLFSSTSDDGSRVTVDGVLVLDHWADCCATWTSDAMHLSAGLHAISYEMQELGGGAYATLNWARAEAISDEAVRFEDINFESRNCIPADYPNDGVLANAVQFFNACDNSDTANYCSRILTSGERLSNQDVCRGSTSNVSTQALRTTASFSRDVSERLLIMISDWFPHLRQLHD